MMEEPNDEEIATNPNRYTFLFANWLLQKKPKAKLAEKIATKISVQFGLISNKFSVLFFKVL